MSLSNLNKEKLNIQTLPEEILVLIFQCINQSKTFYDISLLNSLFKRISNDEWVVHHLKYKFSTVCKKININSIPTLKYSLPNGDILTPYDYKKAIDHKKLKELWISWCNYQKDNFDNYMNDAHKKYLKNIIGDNWIEHFTKVYYKTPLIAAITTDSILGFYISSMEKGFDINSIYMMNDGQYTVLSKFALNGNFDIVKMLIDYFPNLNLNQILKWNCNISGLNKIPMKGTIIDMMNSYPQLKCDKIYNLLVEYGAKSNDTKPKGIINSLIPGAVDITEYFK